MREPVPDYADVMSVEEYLDAVRGGGFIDYDGFGHPVADGKEDDEIFIKPSKGAAAIPSWATHVAWYNR